MKKFMVTMLAIAGLFTAQNAMALQEGSLQAQNSFGLYDVSGFDYAIQPENLDKVVPFHLFTNLSNYEDGSAYVLGTAGKVGPGSITVFYETEKQEFKQTDGNGATNSTESLVTTGLTGLESRYTGKADYLDINDDSNNFKNDSKRTTFKIGYGVDLGLFSLGAIYTPSKEESTRTNNPLDINANPIGITNPETNDTYGSNSSGSFSETFYADRAHTTYWTETGSYSASNVTKTDSDSNLFEIGSRVELGDALSLHVRAGMETFEDKNRTNISLVDIYSYREVGTATADIDPAAGVTDGYSENGTYSYNQSNQDGSVEDGKGFLLSVEPRYKLNSTTEVRFLASYNKATGDVNSSSRTVETSAYNEAQTGTGAYTYSENSINTSTRNDKGDYDGKSFEFGPSLYLTNDKVSFALGAFYSSEEETFSTNWSENFTSTDTMLDPQSLGTTFAQSNFASATTVGSSKFEINSDTWRFPVSTELKVTDKLTVRAGAEFERRTVEQKYRETTVDTSGGIDTFSTTETIAGVTETTSGYFAPAEQIDADGNVTAYDNTVNSERYSEKTEITQDITTYRLGLGYAFTDNLTLDLMFEGSQNNGGTDTRQVFASAVYKF